jgi:hypothetical protein
MEKLSLGPNEQQLRRGIVVLGSLMSHASWGRGQWHVGAGPRSCGAFNAGYARCFIEVREERRCTLAISLVQR